jgi:hypothetical protein
MHTEVAYAEAATEVQLGAMHIEVAHGTEPNLPEPPVQSMETLMLESFSGYGPSLAEMVYSRRWVRYSAGAVPSSSAGREGGWGLRFNVSNSQWYIQTELVKAVQTIVIGVAVNYDVMPTGASYGPFFLNAGKLWDRDPQLTLMISAAGKLQLRRGNATGTLLEEGTTVLAIGNWYFIELRAYIHDTAGNYEVRINEVTEMSGTSVDTQAVVGDNTVRNVYLSPGDFVSNTSDFAYFDSLYIRGDATGDFAGGFLGNVLIESVVPDDNGVYRQWTRSTGTEDYTLIDETPEDDTDYLYASVAGSRITTNFVDLTGADEIKDVMAYHFMSGKSGGMRNIKPFCRNGGNHVDNGSHISRHQVEQPGVSYPYDPATNVAWTVSGFNSAEFGVEAI